MRISTLFSNPDSHSNLQRRKGGGGRGGGGSGAKGGGGEGGGSSASRGVPVSGLPSSSRGVSAYGNGGGKPITIPAGQAFAGRTSGGGTRDQIFGTRAYGSGYPGLPSRGIGGRGFPFGFWPVVWGSGAVGGAAYLHNTEYGSANNASRPGGPLLQAPLQEPNDTTVYHLIADNSTLVSLIDALEQNCTLSSSTILPQTFDPDNSSQPQPQQAIEYYRSSSIVLTLDGYNNSATNSPDNTTLDTPLPTNLNATFLDCLNQTLAAAAPIEDAAVGRDFSTVPLVLVAWMAVRLIQMIV